jgi:hypothetical protein
MQYFQPLGSYLACDFLSFFLLWLTIGSSVLYRNVYIFLDTNGAIHCKKDPNTTNSGTHNRTTTNLHSQSQAVRSII